MEHKRALDPLWQSVRLWQTVMTYLIAAVLAVLVAAEAVQAVQAVQGEVLPAPRVLRRQARWQRMTRSLTRDLVLRASPSTADNAACADAKTTYACAASCTDRLMCNQVGGTWTALRKTACTGRTPYCVNGSCQATIPDDSECQRGSNAPTPSTRYTCFGDLEGYFPDVTDCTKYYFCAGGSAYAMDCSRYANTVYDAKTTMCKPKSQVTCSTIKCTTQNKDLYQEYKPLPSLYALCDDENPTTAVPQVLRCPDGEVLDVKTNPNTPVCAPGCLQAGRYADPDNANGYLECVDLGGGKFSQPVPFLCPAESTFNAVLQRCEPTSSSSTDAPSSSSAAPEAPTP